MYGHSSLMTPRKSSSESDNCSTFSQTLIVSRDLRITGEDLADAEEYAKTLSMDEVRSVRTTSQSSPIAPAEDPDLDQGVGYPRT